MTRYLRRGLSSATLHEAAGRIGALPSRIQAVHPEFYACGPAFPLRCAPGDNLALHHALYLAQPGDVLVADVGDALEYGYWGEILSVAARQRGLAGVVISGGVRDRAALAVVGFPVFADRICIRGTVKDPTHPGALGTPVVLGGVTVTRGDVVVGDADGVVVIPASRSAAALADGQARDDKETQLIVALHNGSTTLDLLQLPAYEPSTTVERPARRVPIEVPGLGHAGAPFPVAVRRGAVVVSSAIHGRDPQTGVLAESIAEQAVGVFTNVRRVIEAAGGTPDDIVKVELFAADASAARTAVNQPWAELFPDASDRPVRHTVTAPLPAGFLLQAEFIAIVDNAPSTLA